MGLPSERTNENGRRPTPTPWVVGSVTQGQAPRNIIRCSLQGTPPEDTAPGGCADLQGGGEADRKPGIGRKRGSEELEPPPRQRAAVQCLQSRLAGTQPERGLA